MRAAVIAIAVLGMATYASAECANACSGHGVCLSSDQCDCFPNYGASDCSQRVCPYGLAWVDNPRGDLNHNGRRDWLASGNLLITKTFFDNGYNSPTSQNIDVKDWETYNPSAQLNEGHFYSECSNKGLCDRAAGQCVCFDGYTGSSCQRTVCPNDCSGHGVCRTVDEIAANSMNKKQADNFGGIVFNDGITNNQLYRLWDQDMAQSCVCDPGYSGPDCSRRECPRGDDPLTHRFSDCGGSACDDELQVWNVVPTAGAGATGVVDWFHIEFTDWTGKIWKTDDFLIGASAVVAGGCSELTSLPVSGGTDDVAAAVKKALKSIPNGIIPDVTVTAAAQGTSGYAISIDFIKNPGNLPNLKFVNSLVKQVTLPKCLAETAVDFTITQGANTNGNKELSTCSNRGICDYDSGLCKCFKGYYGGDCSMQNALSQ